MKYKVFFAIALVSLASIKVEASFSFDSLKAAFARHRRPHTAALQPHTAPAGQEGGGKKVEYVGSEMRVGHMVVGPGTNMELKNIPVTTVLRETITENGKTTVIETTKTKEVPSKIQFGQTTIMPGGSLKIHEPKDEVTRVTRTVNGKTTVTETTKPAERQSKVHLGKTTIMPGGSLKTPEPKGKSTPVTPTAVDSTNRKKNRTGLTSRVAKRVDKDQKNRKGGLLRGVSGRRGAGSARKASTMTPRPATSSRLKAPRIKALRVAAKPRQTFQRRRTAKRAQRVMATSHHHRPQQQVSGTPSLMLHRRGLEVSRG